MACGRISKASIRGVPDPKRLVLAVADYAEGIGDQPAELKLAIQCEQWRVLPEAGGLLDQPVGLIDRMGIILNVYKAVKASMDRGNRNFADWSKQNPDAFRIIASIEKLRMNSNG